jgi:HSP20 family molecular chaperone IbpA
MSLRPDRRLALQTISPDLGGNPDDGVRPPPDGRRRDRALISGMSALAETLFSAVAAETGWDRITLVETRSGSFGSSPGWRPTVNAFRCIDQFVIFVELAGVPPEAIEWQAEANRLVIRGTRPAPEPECDRSNLAQLLAFEIDQGPFERVLNLPHEIDPARITTRHRHGLFQLTLPLAR